MKKSDKAKLAARIVEAARRIVNNERERDPENLARRDQHAKHHGLLWAYFDVLPEAKVDGDLRKGLFAGGPKRYRAWVRFSNSSSRVQPDTAVDGRGAAIKLIEVRDEGERAAPAELDSDGMRRFQQRQQTLCQDFILLSGPTFFARDLPDMTRIFEWLAKGRDLLWYFVRGLRFRSLRAIWKLANKAASPLELTYFSQTAFDLGDDQLQVKYRLRPIAGVEPTEPTRAEKTSGRHLRHVLQRQLRPDEIERDRATHDETTPGQGAADDVLFAFEVQRKAGRDDVERADIEWTGKFEQVAELRIPRQELNVPQRFDFAERMSFNVWNSLRAHAPAGSLNWARATVYPAIAALRTRLNEAVEPAYTPAEWNQLRALPAVVPAGSDSLANIVDRLTPRFLSWPERLLGSSMGKLVPVALFASILLFGHCNPEQIGRPIAIDGPLRALGFGMPSEDWIPPLVYSQRFRDRIKEAKKGERYRPENDPSDLTWLFRYGSMGAEFSAGIPYWIFRVLPRIAPEEFGGTGDWSEFGLLKAYQDDEYYDSYHDLPRGVVLSDTVARIGNHDFVLRLKRVALNCASCHRGEYVDAGGSQYVDGMPNLGFDAAAFKEHTTAALCNPAFTAERVVREIDAALAEEHARRRGAGPAPRLTGFERIVYGELVGLLKREASKKQPLLAWLQHRPQNGMGRLDAFGALRFESLGFEDDEKHSMIATVDLPPIWRQGSDRRPWHHYDGNTQDERARNVGAIVGAGGHPLSVRFEDIQRVADWIDGTLGPPAFPYGSRDAARVQRGQEIYMNKCADCHGHRAGDRWVLGKASCARKPTRDLAHTDPARWRAVDEPYVKKLNDFGERIGLWGAASFEPSAGYVCAPLDGIWARAPYLHNGSVPTLDHLLAGEEGRPTSFIRGNPNYDIDRGGFVWDQEPTDRTFFRYEVVKDGKQLPGNGCGGHNDDNQTVKDPEQRRDLIEYLYTL